ncbi:hypothetical protein Q1695_005793 [Nippostrongylus brasiliensis]|nr:hypothetical protein Q1695_005793 [Nippostrongylus brasiliensis]
MAHTHRCTGIATIAAARIPNVSANVTVDSANSRIAGSTCKQAQPDSSYPSYESMDRSSREPKQGPESLFTKKVTDERATKTPTW